jgi:hypothetical protein
MSIQIQGTSGVVPEVDAIHDALRVTIRPSDVTGAYRAAAVNSTGVAAGAGADSEVFAFRNPSTTKTAIVKRIQFWMHTGATGFTAGVANFYAKVARSFTAAPTNGTTITLATNNCKLATGHETAACALYINDDSVLTSGTETADSTAFAMAAVACTNGTMTLHANGVVLYEPKEGAVPLTLKQDEGFIIYATVPATGVWFHTVVVEWEEYLNADVPVT